MADELCPLVIHRVPNEKIDFHQIISLPVQSVYLTALTLEPLYNRKRDCFSLRNSHRNFLHVAVFASKLWYRKHSYFRRIGSNVLIS